MAVLELAKTGGVINNNLTVLGLPPTGPSVAPTHRQEFKYQLPDPATNTVNIVATFNTRLDPRFYPQLVIDGGSA